MHRVNYRGKILVIIDRGYTVIVLLKLANNLLLAHWRPTLFWLRSTQTDYYQFVDISSVFTMHTKVKFGIRKGLELDSLLFIFATSG